MIRGHKNNCVIKEGQTLKVQGQSTWDMQFNAYMSSLGESLFWNSSPSYKYDSLLRRRNSLLLGLIYHLWFFSWKRVNCIEFPMKCIAWSAKFLSSAIMKLSFTFGEILSHLQEGICHHVRNFSQHLNVAGQHLWIVLLKIFFFGKTQGGKSPSFELLQFDTTINYNIYTTMTCACNGLTLILSTPESA